jgi:hypothetical protein
VDDQIKMTSAISELEVSSQIEQSPQAPAEDRIKTSMSFKEESKNSLVRFRSLDQLLIDNFSLIAGSYEGRDKTVKFLQYLAKYMSWVSDRHQSSELGQ